jgi:hypothetical protein
MAGSTPPSAVGAMSADAATAGAALPTQWVVSCQPDQQAQIRQTLQHGAPLAEVTCIDRGFGPASSSTVRPVQTVPQYDVVSLEDEIAVAPPSRVRTRPAVYTTQERREAPAPRRQEGRSWQKSAVIIGSSAGVGAGVGAAVGGKKGALIGAAIGGGGAAIWDQTTRRK